MQVCFGFSPRGDSEMVDDVFSAEVQVLFLVVENVLLANGPSLSLTVGNIIFLRCILAEGERKILL